MDNKDWETVIDVLMEKNKLKDMWNLVTMVAPMWNVKILKELYQNGWQPEEPNEKFLYHDLVGKGDAFGWEPPDLDKMIKCRYVVLENAELSRALNIKTCIVSQNNHSVVCHEENKIKLWDISDAQGIKRERFSEVKIRSKFPFIKESEASKSWRLQNKQTSDNNSERIRSFNISPDNKYLVIGHSNGTICVYNLPTLSPSKVFETGSGDIQNLAICAEGTKIGIVGTNHIGIWSFPDGEKLYEIGFKGKVKSTSINKNSRILAINGRNWVGICRFPECIYKEIQYIEAGIQVGVVDTDYFRIVALNPNGDLLAVGGTTQLHEIGIIQLIDISKWKKLRKLDDKHISNSNTCLSINPDSTLLASGDQSGNLDFWSLPSGQHIHKLKAHRGQVKCMSFCQKENLLSSVGGGNGCLVLQLDFINFYQLPIQQNYLNYIQFIENMLDESNLEEKERTWLEFQLAIIRWNMRHDVEIDESSYRIDAGEFDIELD